MRRRFNTAGPCRPGVHYMVPPLQRLPEALELVDLMEYFVVHAPRQTGKTTILMTLAQELTAKGEYAAVYFSCEVGEPAGDDYGEAQHILLKEIRRVAAKALPPDLRPPHWPEVPGGNLLIEALAAWARACPRPLVLFFDEIDALQGTSLLSVLRQLRAGASDRPDGFPASVVLCGLRDVRDYKIASGGDPSRLGTASPFNIKIESLRIGDFSSDEVRDLYGQHTADTGQVFTGDALARVFDYTRGQPWLVNALAREVVEKMRVPVSQPVTADHVDEAKERLILARASHMDSLDQRLAEPRIRRVIEPVLAGELPDTDETYDNDVRYVADLGLITPGKTIEVANPIYREVIVWVLGTWTERRLVAEPRRFVRVDGQLDFPLLLHEFVDFWLANAEILQERTSYREAAAQLIFMAYLHKVVNGGGYIDREYGLGRGRTDVLVRWPYLDSDGRRQWQREAIELKVWRARRADPTKDGLAQLDGYLARLSLDHGTLIIFDQRPGALPLPERTQLAEERTESGRRVTLLRA